MLLYNNLRQHTADAPRCAEVRGACGTRRRRRVRGRDRGRRRAISGPHGGRDDTRTLLPKWQPLRGEVKSQTRLGLRFVDFVARCPGRRKAAEENNQERKLLVASSDVSRQPGGAKLD